MGQVEIIEVLDEDLLYRRIHPNFRKNGQVSSAIFKQRTPDLSIDIAKLTTPEQSLLGYPYYGLAGIIAQVPRELGLDIYHKPSATNYAHGLIYGKINDRKAKKMAKSATLIKEP